MASDFLINNNFLLTPVGPNNPIVVGNTYEPRALFSINASNRLQGTLWIVKNGVQLVSDLGIASFIIRDQDGNDIGIAETNLLADANGLYQITPVLADVIQDLTHYTIELNILAESQVRRGVVGITLGE